MKAKFITKRKSIYESYEEAIEFERNMESFESKLQSYSSSLWKEFEKESGDLWNELNAENWFQAFKADPIACITMKEQLNSYINMIDESLNENIKIQGHNLDVLRIKNRKIYAGDDGIMGNNDVFIPWTILKEIMKRYAD